MRLELKTNDNSREAKSGWGIFKGKSLVLLVIGVALFVALFRIFESYQLDLYVSLPVSLMPLGAIIVFVKFFLIGKQKNYAEDLFLWGRWKLRCALYMNGLLDRPPQLWFTEDRPQYPKL